MDMDMNKISSKFLRIIRDWIDKIIPEKTKDCLRTKIGVIVQSSGNVYSVILAGDYENYLQLKQELAEGKISQEEYNHYVSLLTLDNLVAIRADTYSVNDYVTIGVVDNKLTNAFIIYKNIKREA